MKNKILIVSCLSIGSIFKTYAAAGNANDGLLGSLVIMGFLLFLAGLLYAIDYFPRNGNKLFRKVFIFSKKMIAYLVSLIGKARSDRFDPSYTS